MAELEFAALQRQCLDRRVPSQADVVRDVAIWEGRTQSGQDDRDVALYHARYAYKTYPALPATKVVVMY